MQIIRIAVQTHIQGDRSTTRKRYIRRESIRDLKYSDCFFNLCLFAKNLNLIEEEYQPIRFADYTSEKLVNLLDKTK